MSFKEIGLCPFLQNFLEFLENPEEMLRSHVVKRNSVPTCLELVVLERGGSICEQNLLWILGIE